MAWGRCATGSAGGHPECLPQPLDVPPLGGFGADAHAEHLRPFEDGGRQVGLATVVYAAGDLEVVGGEGGLVESGLEENAWNRRPSWMCESRKVLGLLSTKKKRKMTECHAPGLTSHASSTKPSFISVLRGTGPGCRPPAKRTAAPCPLLSSASSTPISVAAICARASCGSTAPGAGTTGWCRSPARGVDFAHPAGVGGWQKAPPGSVSASSPPCPCASGCCPCPKCCATSWLTMGNSAVPWRKQ